MSDVFIYGTPTIQPYRVGGNSGPWRWMNVGDLTLQLIIGDTSLTTTVKDGFTSDLASIPKWAQWLFALNPYEPQVVLPALVHDWLTPTDAERYDISDPFGTRPIFPQTIAAGVFYELMRATEVPMLRRRVYYSAVVAAISGKYW